MNPADSPYIRVQLPGDDQWCYVDLRQLEEVRQANDNVNHSILLLKDGAVCYSIDSKDHINYLRSQKLWKS